MAKVKPRVKVPKKASANEVVTIKTLISHPMESGQRKDKKTGEAIPRKIINKFAATFNGEPVFMANIEPSVSANPYIEFQMRVPESGSVRFEWTDDDGSVYDLEKKITVA
ncbi:Sulfur oxidation Z protein [Pseudovibrio sp. FO-BEG1]|uniref:Sulfur compound chelating protein SoxZ n=2 Tax=Pseudovibrio TaxID=258255 RepID=A0A1I7C0S2_9HYPH|nr:MULTISPECIES: thiosulfate oxidation carrier complex protein SoxZ [Pseudovibrio]AEV35877.1 Sulfur oxidation Z protein [Pseudovibrio sp. FO-BEG1]EEA92438.1 sulfur oxidation protein [Pseudovibrio sp. JE062]QUS56725.1 thiosulfate oxidation carrier complex protein SoxZ [Pseudovibrio brasiliensis]SFT93026.1 sulfur compound chelating protein SoxZ [Pseudovibrio denitrificans]